jgi:hypothetical protein
MIYNTYSKNPPYNLRRVRGNEDAGLFFDRAGAIFMRAERM